MKKGNYNSQANYRSHANYCSHANYFSNANYFSTTNCYSSANYNSYANHNSDANYYSFANYDSYANCFSAANYRCYGAFRSMFCKEKYGIVHMVFNKQLTEDEYNRLRDKIEIDFGKVAWTNHAQVLGNDNSTGEDLKLINDWSNRKEAWRPVKDGLLKLADLEIWDDEANKIVALITGWDVNKELSQNPN